LLDEYAAAVQHINALSASSWQSTSIFLAATLAGTVIAAQLEPDSGGELAIVWVLSAGASILLILWMLMVRRFVYFQAIDQHRLTELEETLGFRRAGYVQIMEHWEDRTDEDLWSQLSESEKDSLEELRARLVRLEFPLTGRLGASLGYAHTSTLTYWIGVLVALGWIALAAVQTYRFLSGDFDATLPLPGPPAPTPGSQA